MKILDHQNGDALVQSEAAFGNPAALRTTRESGSETARQLPIPHQLGVVLAEMAQCRQC